MHGCLDRYGLADEYRVNIEVNHATLAGHSFHHEVAYAIDNGIFGSIDANRGDPQNGWDTAAVVSSFVLNAKFGYDQGFAHYDDRLPDRDDDKPGNPWEGHEVDGRFWSNGEDAPTAGQA